MIGENTYERLAKGESAAISETRAAMESNSLTQAEVTRAWKTIIAANLEGRPEAAELNRLGFSTTETRQEPAARTAYENLFMVSAYPGFAGIYAPAIGVGAALARIRKGEIAGGALETAWYMEAAKKALVRAAGAIENAIADAALGGKDTSEAEANLVFVLEALCQAEGPEVRQVLGRFAQEGYSEEVRQAAGKGVGPIRVRSEIEDARADKEFLLESVHFDETSPQRLYVEFIFGAVEAAYSEDASQLDRAIAVRQLATFGAMPGEIASLLDAQSMRLITENVENALLYVVAQGEPRLMAEAAVALERMGSDRIEGILEKVVARLGEQTPNGALAAETLSKIAGAKLEIEIVGRLPPPVPPRAKTPPRPPRPAPRAPIRL